MWWLWSHWILMYRWRSQYWSNSSVIITTIRDRYWSKRPYTFEPNKFTTSFKFLFMISFTMITSISNRCLRIFFFRWFPPSYKAKDGWWLWSWWWWRWWFRKSIEKKRLFRSRNLAEIKTQLIQLIFSAIFVGDSIRRVSIDS